jgi:hypothetical protein
MGSYGVSLAKVETMSVVSDHAGVQLDRCAPLGARQIYEVVVEQFAVTLGARVRDRDEVVHVEDAPVDEVGGYVKARRSMPLALVSDPDQPVAFGGSSFEAGLELVGRDVVAENVDDFQDLG